MMTHTFRSFFAVIIILFYKNIDKYNMLLNISILYNKKCYQCVFFYYGIEIISVMKLFPYCTDMGHKSSYLHCLEIQPSAI
jgi:hypothetical protein